MKTIHDIRRSNARKLRDGVGGNSSFATMIDREPTQTSRFMGDGATKNIGDSMARHIEKMFRPACRMARSRTPDNEHHKKPDVSITNKQITLVPVISWVQAGAWKEVGYSEVDLSTAETYPCPVPCGEMTYILRVIGDSMIDEYRPRHDFVDPEVPACHGDDVIALMHDTGETTFKRLIEDGTQRYLKALNPNWPEPYIKINGNCSIIGTVIFSGKPRRYKIKA